MILVSACLIGERVRYDGRVLPVADEWLRRWNRQGRLLAFCPEVGGGLPVPRQRAEIVGGGGDAVFDGAARVVAQDGKDITAAFVGGAGKAFALCQALAIRLAVLSESSPSCGSATIYDGSFAGTKIAGMGVTSALLRKHGIRVFNQHETKMLADYIDNSGFFTSGTENSKSHG
jgi:uncharacterized protein YbbK (DUF523 family)